MCINIYMNMDYKTKGVTSYCIFVRRKALFFFRTDVQEISETLVLLLFS